jgi:hypothetical protein
MREYDRFFQVEKQVEQRGIGRITLSNTRQPAASPADGERIYLKVLGRSHKYKSPVVLFLPQSLRACKVFPDQKVNLILKSSKVI